MNYDLMKTRLKDLNGRYCLLIKELPEMAERRQPHSGGCTWLKSEENEEARRLLFNPEEPRSCFFRAREEPQKISKPSEVRGKYKRKR